MSWHWLPTDDYDPVKGANCCAMKYLTSLAGSIDATDTRPHDRGIVRSSQAFYDFSRDVNIVGDPKATILFARVAFDTTEDTLRFFFGKYGIIKRLTLVRHIVTGASRGYGFVEYEREGSAHSAFTGAHRAVIDGRQILVDFERERSMQGWIPRRLGGGLGGRKESGQLRFGGRDRPFRKPLLAATREAQWALQMMHCGRGGHEGRPSSAASDRGWRDEKRLRDQHWERARDDRKDERRDDRRHDRDTGERRAYLKEERREGDTRRENRDRYDRYGDSERDRHRSSRRENNDERHKRSRDERYEDDRGRRDEREHRSHRDEEKRY